MRTYGVEHWPTKALRWLLVNLAMVKSRTLRDLRRAVEFELLARDLEQDFSDTSSLPAGLGMLPQHRRGADDVARAFRVAPISRVQ